MLALNEKDIRLLQDSEATLASLARAERPLEEVQELTVERSNGTFDAGTSENIEEEETDVHDFVNASIAAEGRTSKKHQLKADLRREQEFKEKEARELEKSR